MRPVTPVRNAHVVVIANTGPDAAQLLDYSILLHAIRGSSARSVMAVVPYFAYARQDRRDQPQGPVSAALVAKLLEAAGADRVVLVDPHSAVTPQAFRIRVDLVDPIPVLVAGIPSACRRDAIVVAPDAGARERAQELAKVLGGVDVLVLAKSRPRPNVARIASLRASDTARVHGRTAVLVDDMIDTAGTITAAADLLRKAGARQIVILATHAVCSGPAFDRLRRAQLRRIVVSDSLPRTYPSSVPVRVVSLATALTSVISATYAGDH